MALLLCIVCTMPCGAAETAEAQPTTTQQPVELVVGTPGRLDSLQYHATQRRVPGPGEVEILVQAAALNYKDILKAMGTIATQILEDTYFGAAFGMECAGTVVAVGEGGTAPARWRCRGSHHQPGEFSLLCHRPSDLCHPEASGIVYAPGPALYGLPDGVLCPGGSGTPAPGSAS